MITTLIRIVLKTVLILVALTAIGQMPVRGDSIENRYHNFVNSDQFQKSFWTLALPITWTTQKVDELVTAMRSQAHRAAAR